VSLGQELRLQDYAQNRKTASASAFGAASAFNTTQPAATGAFGSQTDQPTQGGIFGGGTTNTTTGSGFNAFAQNNQQAPQPNSGVFGGSAFGQQQQPGGFSAFAQQGPPQQPQQGGIFGSGSAFGNTANRPAFGSSSNAFGSSRFVSIDRLTDTHCSCSKQRQPQMLLVP